MRRRTSPASRRERSLLLAAALLVALAGDARADDDPLGKATAALVAGDHQAAIAGYEALFREGARHPALFYNLGNAYYRRAAEGTRDSLGRAILNYERALALDPGDADAAHNLAVAREAAVARFGEDKVVGAAALPLWLQLARRFPPDLVALLLLVLDVLVFAGLLVLRAQGPGLLRTALIVLDAMLAAAALAVLLLFAAQRYAVPRVRLGTVVVDEVVLREGPDPTRRELPRLHAGHRVRVVGESRGYLRVRLANGMDGWLPGNTVEEW